MKLFEEIMPDKVVTILRPPIVFSSNSFSVPVTPPIAVAYLAAVLLKNGFSVNPIDAIGEDLHHIERMPRGRMCQGLSFDAIIKRIGPDTDILAISIMFSQEWPIIRELINRIREAYPDIIIIAGGEHVSALPEFCLLDCAALDYCAIGEGEELLLEFISVKRRGQSVNGISGLCYRDGSQITVNSRRQRIANLDDLPWPAWDLIPIENYLTCNYGGAGTNTGRGMPVIATRGCPYSCKFCSNNTMWGQKYIMRSVVSVIKEIKYYVDKYNVTHIEFYDLTAIIKKEWIMDFCRLYLENNLYLSWSLPTGTRSEALDKEVIDMLYKTNCKYLVYAPESGSAITLKDIRKEVNIDSLVLSVRAAVARGINTRCNLVIGFPNEKLKDLFETLFFQMKLAFYGVDDVPLYLFSPYPGSEFYNYLTNNNKIQYINDNYFDSLLGQMDLNSCTIYSDYISGRTIRWLRLISMSMFYGISYVTRPSRIIRSFKNIFIYKKTNTVFEQRLLEKLQRMKNN